MFPRPAGNETVPGRAAMTGRTARIPDVQNDPDIFPPAKRLGVRAGFSVPMLRDGKVIGVIALSRFEPGGFADDAIAVIDAFAE